MWIRTQQNLVDQDSCITEGRISEGPLYFLLESGTVKYGSERWSCGTLRLWRSPPECRKRKLRLIGIKWTQEYYKHVALHHLSSTLTRPDQKVQSLFCVQWVSHISPHWSFLVVFDMEARDANFFDQSLWFVLDASWPTRSFQIMRG